MKKTWFLLDEIGAPKLQELRKYFDEGGTFVVVDKSVPRGAIPFAFPERALVFDLRYEGGLNIVRGVHPRMEGLWTQYSNLDTGLARNVTISHTITDATPIENWRSERHDLQVAPTGALSSEDYRHQHNHYQNLHSEVYNFARDLNGVAVWGDSGAFAPGGKSWGGFFSARSWPVKWQGYTPENLFQYKEEDFDAALVGIEIDVLNAGQDWNVRSPLEPNALGKVGLQVVGFGKKNTAAVEIRSEDSDDAARGPDDRRGTWHWGIIMRGSLAHDSTVLMSENGRIARGIDLDKTTFTEGALRITGAGPSSGLMFDGGRGGEIYSAASNAGPSLNLKVGVGGLKIYDSSGTKVLMEVADSGVTINRPGQNGATDAALRSTTPPASGGLLHRTLRRMRGFRASGARRGGTAATAEASGGSNAAQTSSNSLIGEYLPSPEIMFPVAEALFSRLSQEDVVEIERVAAEKNIQLPPRSNFEFWRVEVIRWGVYLLPAIAQKTGLKNAVPPGDIHNMHTLDVDCGSLYDPNLLVEGCLAVGAPLLPNMRCLDFGCSSGRVIRTMKAAYPELSWVGCDPEANTVAWAAREFPGIEFFSSPRVPPLPVESGSFDFVYAISIWSHFRQDLASAWLDEMARIVRPGGHLWFSTHGMTSLAQWKGDASPARRIELEKIARTLAVEGFCFEDAYKKSGDWGADTSSWGMAYFTPAWLARQLMPNWRLAYYRPGYLAWNQDVYILQRR